MKKSLSFAVLIIALISLNGCSQSIDKQDPLKKEIIKTLDSSKTYHDSLPENKIVTPESPEVINPE